MLDAFLLLWMFVKFALIYIGLSYVVSEFPRGVRSVRITRPDRSR